MNSHNAADLLFRDLMKLLTMVIGYVGGHLLAAYQKERLNFGEKRWQKTVIYLEALILVWFLCFQFRASPSAIEIERSVLIGIPCLIGVMIVQEKKSISS